MLQTLQGVISFCMSCAKAVDGITLDPKFLRGGFRRGVTMNRLMLLGFLLATATAQGSGTLQLGKPTVEQDRITIPVVLGGDLSGGVSAMDFRFRYNPEAVQPVSVVAGAAAEIADKRVMSNLRTPGEYSVVMMGFNQSSCGPGEAIKIVLQRLQGADQKWNLSLADATLSSIDGRLIESQVLPSDIEASPENEEEEKEETERRPQLPDVEQGVSEEPTEEPGAQQGVVYEMPVDASVGEGAAESRASDRLKSAMASAEDVRHGIESPEQVPEAESTAAVEPGTADGDTGVDAAGHETGRIDTARVTDSVKPFRDRVLQDSTVEPQSGAGAAEMPAKAAGAGTYAGYVLVFLLVFLVLAVVFWRRSRLIG